jgi:hypothetical protein
MAMAWHPDHLSRQTVQFIEFVRQHVAQRPWLLDPDSYRTWMP